jgi:hypothetical protein
MECGFALIVKFPHSLLTLIAHHFELIVELLDLNVERAEGSINSHHRVAPSMKSSPLSLEYDLTREHRYVADRHLVWISSRSLDVGCDLVKSNLELVAVTRRDVEARALNVPEEGDRLLYFADDVLPT